MEVLGDEFSMSQDQGIILPQTEFCLQMHFRAMKPVNLKRAVRLEVGFYEDRVSDKERLRRKRGSQLYTISLAAGETEQRVASQVP